MSSGNTVADFSPKGQPRRVEKLEDFGARERTRTSTTLRSLAPEASASASSATRARVKKLAPGGANHTRHFQFCPRPSPLSTPADGQAKSGKICFGGRQRRVV